MNDAPDRPLFELADLILAVGRQLQVVKNDAEIYGGGAWTPLESAVMRFIDRTPGTTAGAASDATRLTSSNLSRALRGLEAKGMIRRERDPNDARRFRLYPTEEAQANLRQLRTLWGHYLAGVVEPDAARRAVAILGAIEIALNARS